VAECRRGDEVVRSKENVLARADSFEHENVFYLLKSSPGETHAAFAVADRPSEAGDD